MKVYHSNGGRCVQTDSLRRQRHRIGIALACFDTSHHVFELLGHRLSDIADEAAVGYDAVNAEGRFESQRTFRVGGNHLVVLSSNKSVRQPSRRGRW